MPRRLEEVTVREGGPPNTSVYTILSKTIDINYFSSKFKQLLPEKLLIDHF
jgi:hypothetical protein